MQYIVNAANKRISAPASINSNAKTPARELASEPAVRAVVKTTTTETSTVAPQHVEASTVTTAMQIVCQESGIALGELTDESRFVDVGVDSLLSLVISSRIRDELGIDFESSVFLDVTTIGSFKTYLKGLCGRTEASTTVTEVIEEEIVPVNGKSLQVDTQEVEGAWKRTLDIIAEESRIDIAELTSNTSFSDIGVDSLLSLVICSRLRDEVGLDIDDKSLFLELTTIETLRNYVSGGPQDSTESPGSSSDSPSSTTSFDSPSSTSSPSSVKDFASTPEIEVDQDQDLDPVKPAWSITLQGSSKRSTERLFLFPDGCGAATSYVNIPKISHSTAVIGFNSPFMR